MEIVKILLLIAVIFAPLLHALYYLGIAVTGAGFSWFSAHYSLPTRWEGAYTDYSGFLQRNFVVFKKYSALAIEAKANSGTFDFVVKGPDGSVLSPASGTYGRDVSVLIDVRHLKRCTVALRMERFNGRFRIALQ